MSTVLFNQAIETKEEFPPMTAKVQYITTMEAAERFGVDRVTILRWIEAGHFPGARRAGFGKTSPYLIPLDEVKQAAARLGLPPTEE